MKKILKSTIGEQTRPQYAFSRAPWALAPIVFRKVIHREALLWARLGQHPQVALPAGDRGGLVEIDVIDVRRSSRQMSASA
jgi:hypothetical protein